MGIHDLVAMVIQYGKYSILPGKCFVELLANQFNHRNFKRDTLTASHLCMELYLEICLCACIMQITSQACLLLK